ncbi:hypothetical protein CWB72_09365 [Pseudoalteromonas phenolica]|nr:hypothetical protein CWB72_09365 [Pseudoalteromonas phenolica]
MMALNATLVGELIVIAIVITTIALKVSENYIDSSYKPSYIINILSIGCFLVLGLSYFIYAMHRIFKERNG